MKLPARLVTHLEAGVPDMLVAYLATSLLDGRVNLYPTPFTDVVYDELVVMPDLFTQKTKVALNENGAAALSVDLGDDTHWLLQGRADMVQWGHPNAFRLFGLPAGKVLEQWGDWEESVEPVLDALEAAARPAVFAQRGVIIFKPEHIVEVAP